MSNREKENSMSEEKITRTKLLQVRLTKKEYDHINALCKRSTCRKMSEYLRKLLLGKPVTINQRNQSLDDFMAEMIQLRRELNAIGTNYNQAVKKLHSLQQFQEIKPWLLFNENLGKILLGKVAEIKTRISQINDQWLQ